MKTTLRHLAAAGLASLSAATPLPQTTSLASSGGLLSGLFSGLLGERPKIIVKELQKETTSLTVVIGGTGSTGLGNFGNLGSLGNLGDLGNLGGTGSIGLGDFGSLGDLGDLGSLGGTGSTGTAGGLLGSLGTLGVSDDATTPSLSGIGGSGTSGSLLGSTANDLTDNTTCKANILIFARGTSEEGNMGETVGPALQSKLNQLMPNQFMFQGVTYSADVAGDIALGTPGGQVATSLIDQCAKQCPDTQMFVSGYSEGAMVAHKGVANAQAASKAKVAGVLVYGDPFDGQTISGYPESKVKTFCAQGDEVCKEMFVISAAHLSYVGADTDAGAEWIQQVATGNGTVSSS